MAFTQLPGSNPYVYQGTDLADQGVFTTSNFIAIGEGNNDLFNLGNVSQATVLGGQGNDLVTQNIAAGGGISALNPAQALLQGYVAGNQGDDTLGQVQLGIAGTISAFLGGQGNDTIFVAQNQSTQVNGNNGNDTINVGGLALWASGALINTANSSIWGGQGDDVINVNDGTLLSTQVGGNLGNDSIAISVLTTTTVLTGTTFEGGDGNDTINGGASVVGLNIIGDGADGGFQPNIGGADFLTGGQRIDTIAGGGLNDVLNGGVTTAALDPSFTVGFGDLLSGGTGSNRFVFGANQSSNTFTSIANTASAGNFVGQTLQFNSVQIDTITDWSSAAGGANVIQNAASSTYSALAGQIGATAATVMTVFRGSVVSSATGDFAFQVNTIGNDALAVAVSSTANSSVVVGNATLLRGAGNFSFSQANFI